MAEPQYAEYATHRDMHLHMHMHLHMNMLMQRQKDRNFSVMYSGLVICFHGPLI